ncbi:MAG TPA: NAD(+) diphosphatase [Steroidobacteraceae bacterium]|nr:NAD(+) diphosphatase [Steroidobacteraceae bacterium]
MRERNVFAGPYLERAGHLRADPAWLESALGDARSRVVPVWNSRSLVRPAPDDGGLTLHAALLGLDEIPPEHRNGNDLILLGRFDEASLFAYEFDGAEPPASPAGTRFEELRSVAAMMPEDQAGLLSYARAMVTWRRTHRYCGRCGARTLPAKGGHVLVCTNPACRHEQFPRIDPAIIVLVADEEQALLGRQAAWPPGRYSTIAGFVEPGESLEDAVAREVHEETGILVDAIEYHSSQPWPFPSSLMLGFTAHALSKTIHLRDQELEDARWFTRADIIDGRPLLPPRLSISFRLIEHWFDAAAERPLKELQARAAGQRAR